MRKFVKLEDAKLKVENLLGKQVNVRLNRGRNRVKNYVGVVSEAHANVFVVKLTNNALFDRISCSYTDMLCGEVMIKEVVSQTLV